MADPSARRTVWVMPSLDVEHDLLARHAVIGAVDEVGRGALAGPVSCGLVVLTAPVGPPPVSLADSKDLSAAARESLVDPVRAWVRTSAVGHASASEIDDVGIINALGLAAERALLTLVERPTVIVLDGNVDWLSRRDAFAGIEIITRVKADRDCASVAAASVLAKVARDRYMSELDDPGYGWATHKGYGTAAHREAIRRLGPGKEHRRSWNLLG